MKNITFKHAGGGNELYAKVPLDQLHLIPELPKIYPEFSMFKELPSWAIFAKHAKGLKFSNMKMTCVKKDFRVPIVLDDVQESVFIGTKIVQDGKQKEIFQHNTKKITVQ